MKGMYKEEDWKEIQYYEENLERNIKECVKLISHNIIAIFWAVEPNKP